MTDKVKEIYAASGIRNGIVVVYSHHTTCSVIVVAVDGEMDIGEFGRIHFIDRDQTRGRTRTVQVMVIGE